MSRPTGQLPADDRTVLALDVGGTKLAAALADPVRGTLTRMRTAVTPRGDGRQVWQALSALVAPYLAEPCGLAAVGVGCPGPLNIADGTVSPVNIAGWRNFPLRARLAELTCARVTLANDAVCAAVGEGDLLLAPLTEQCRRHGANAFVRRLRVKLAELTGPVAGLTGAAELAADRWWPPASRELRFTARLGPDG